MVAFAPLRVAAVEPDTDDSVVVTFDTEDDERFRFRHGQHVTLRHEVDGVELRRSYSICSPAPDGPLRIAVKHLPGGAVSTWVTEKLREGDVVDVMTPVGHFGHELDPDSSRRYLAVAAGSGITPVLSIVATILDGEPRSFVSLVYVNRTSQSTMLLEDVEAIRDRHLGRLQLWYVFTREPTEIELLSGRPDRERFDAMIRAGILPSRPDEVFLCGPLDLVDCVTGSLTAAGVSADRIHRELFTTPQVGVAVPRQVREVDTSVPPVARGRVTLNGRHTTFDLFDDDTVLEAVERVRTDAPFSCRSGVCSTCHARLLEGEVSMAACYGLDAQEVSSGHILTCQARPLTAEIAVDYDA